MDNIQPVVKDPLTPELASDAIVPLGVPPAPPAPGTKTDPALLLEALKDERTKRQTLEADLILAREELNNLKTNPTIPPESMSDEGRELDGKIKTLEQQLSGLQADNAKKDVLITYPILREKWAELEEFRKLPENKGMNLRTSAKSFLVENGLLEAPRKGLEKTTGGPRVATPSGMSEDDVKVLRETSPKKYYQMVKNGQLKIAPSQE
jgi:hypothetical protein